MMKQSFIILVLFISSLGFSQEVNSINPKLTQKTWVDDETRTINDYQVTRLHGADYGNSRNATFGMITSIAYNKGNSGKGELEFYITRYEQSQANLKWYMIIIRGEDDKEIIFEKKLDYSSAEMPDGNYFWNYTTISLPDNIHPPFYVNIRDRNMQMLYTTKFFIEE